MLKHADWTETFRGAVLSSEYDPEATMNSPMYVSRFDQATWFLLRAIGVTPRSIKEGGRRIAVIRQNFQYLRELRGGELVVIKSGFVAVGEKHFRFIHRMIDIDTGDLIATSDCTAVEASLRANRAVKLPAAHRKAAEGLLVTFNVKEATR